MNGMFIPVSSSNLAAVRYDETARTLDVRFHHGGIYRYFGVGTGVYHGLLMAESHGKYFHRTIRDVFPFVRLT